MSFPRPIISQDGLPSKGVPGYGITYGVQALVFADANTTVVPSDLFKGLWNTNPFTTAKVITLPTIAVLEAAFPDINIGDSWVFWIKGGTSGGTFSLPSGWTVTSGTSFFTGLNHILITKTGDGAYSFRISA